MNRQLLGHLEIEKTNNSSANIIIIVIETRKNYDKKSQNVFISVYKVSNTNFTWSILIFLNKEGFYLNNFVSNAVTREI